MSRQTRPQRRVRGAELATVEALLPMRLAPRSSSTWGALWRVARRLGCRPAQLRRCLLGCVVSARAAGRILAAARGAR